MPIHKRSAWNHHCQDSPPWKQDGRWHSAKLVAKWQAVVAETCDPPRAASTAAGITVPSHDRRSTPLASTATATTWSIAPAIQSKVHPLTGHHEAISRPSLRGSSPPSISPDQCQQLWYFPPQLIVHPPPLEPQQKRRSCAYQDAITARKRKRAQSRRQDWYRSMMDQAVADSDGSDRASNQVTDMAMLDPPHTVTGEGVPQTLEQRPQILADKTPTPKESLGHTMSDEITVEKSGVGDLADVISVLAEKLERVQPAGARPSDIRIELASLAGEGLATSAVIQEVQPSQAISDSSDVLLSQTQHSQQLMPLWEEIQELVVALCSKMPELERQAAEGVVQLGLDRLDDGVLQGLCVNELATYAGDSEQTFTISYQTSLYLFHILFFSKVRELTSAPSRLFLDAIQSAARLHPRAAMDGILLPLMCQEDNALTKAHMELTFSILKGQATTTLTHFLGEWLAARTSPVASKGHDTSLRPQQQQHKATLERFLPSKLQPLLAHRPSSFSVLGSTNHLAGPQDPGPPSFSVPTCLSSEIQVSLLQSIVSLPVLAKSPLPSRLWYQLCENLESLWSAIHGLVSQQHASSDLSKAQRAWVKALYLPSLTALPTSSSSSSSAPTEGIRLFNAKLSPVLVLWIMRHGPSCQDIAILQRLQQFCETKLDTKNSKPILSKIEALLKKKAK